MSDPVTQMQEQLDRVNEEASRLRDERDHYRENVIPDLQSRLDQERQRREQAEGLLREAKAGFVQHKASLLDYCPACRNRVKAIDKHFGDYDG